MGYIKKLKNNELVGGTDKTTIYPVTSAEAVFEEVSENNFQSQKSINVDRLERIETLEAHDENHEGRVSTLEEHDSDHESRVQELEDTMPTAVKSITINGGTKTYTVDDEGNVNLDVYTTESAEGQATLAEEVGDIRSIVGTKDSPASDTLVNRVGELETLVGGSGQGSVNTRIANTKAEILGDTAEGYNTLGKVEDKIQEEVTRATEAETYIQEEYDTLYQSLSGTDIIIGAKPSSGQQANKIYRVPGDNNGTANDAYYTDYMWYNNAWVRMATYEVANLEAQVSSYKCTTAAGTAAKVVNATMNPNHPHLDAYEKIAGGHFKVWMENANTAASGVTLKIGSANAATLLYNGEEVNSSNTWDAGETISVYYDPTYNSNAGAYIASNAQGGSNRKIDAYLLGDLRTLAVGQTYEENEAVKTSDKQLLRVSKKIKAMNLTDEVASGDLKAIASGTYVGTYKAQKNVKSYTDTTYTDGNYALGSPAGAIIQVTVDSTAIAALEEPTDISVTIAGIEFTVTVDSTMNSATIVAAAIVADFGTQSEWKLTDNSDGTITLISKVAKAEVPTISSDTGETGVTVGFVESSDYAGTTALSKYDGTAWTVVADLDTYASDFVDIGETDATKMWKKLDTTDLTTSYTKQNSVADDFLYNSNAFISENLFNLEAVRISDIINNSYSTRTKDTNTNTIQITVSTKDKNNARNVVIWPFILKAGKKYRLSFTYANGMNAVITPTLRSYSNALIGNIVDINNYTLSLPIGSGSVDCIFIPKQNSERLCITYPAATGVGRYIRLDNLFIGEVYSVTELAKKHSKDIEKSIKDTNNIIDINPMSYDKPLVIEVDYTWNKSTTGNSHYGIPAKSGERFIITPGERITQYGFLTSPNGTSGGNVTTWLPGYETLYTIPVGETREIFIPENDYDTIYIYILHLTSSGAYDYTPSSIKKYVPAVKDSEAIHNNLDSLNNAVAKLESTVTRLDLTEKDEDGITYKTYTGNPLIPVYNKFGWKNIGPTADYRTEQACSIWGDYAFCFNTAENTGGCALDIVNLKTRKTVGAYKGSRVYNIPTDGNYHMGSSQFSNIYYDENDEFPLIYIEGIANKLIVGRVVPENSAQLYHIEIVQVINYSGITDNNATYHIAFDHTRGYLVLFHGGWMKIKTLLPPAIKDGSGNYITNVSITDADLIEQYEVSGYTQPIDVPQSGSCHNGLLFYTNGIVRTEQRLIVIDLRTHAVVNDVSTWQLVKDAEPESIDFWGEIPILFTREGMFRLWF